MTKNNPVLTLWERLRSLEKFSFQARSGEGSSMNWNGGGAGRIELIFPDRDGIVTKEQGHFTPVGGRPIGTSNTYRWKRLPHGAGIQLSHLRYGMDNPVELLTLIPQAPTVLVSKRPHYCAPDTYETTVVLDGGGFQMEWRIRGEYKNEIICCRYA